ncbi:MAG: DUF1289 domain-containing protein [Betaproteobacteria bacterium]|nr:DUF1289 domain-containing protein [Thiomonas sp.]MDE2129639.1 DUF1289 domain-containing protein [Betaproteobacteria bacterium]
MRVPSPCIQVCTMDEASGLCRGCQRTLDEIAAWSALSDTEKLRVWKRIRARRLAPPPAGGPIRRG